MESYSKYREDTINRLSQEIRLSRDIEAGIWKGKYDVKYQHILPLEEPNSISARKKAIKDYLGITIEDTFFGNHRKKEASLHQYAHHLNSSQLLCYMSFGSMLKDDCSPNENLIKMLSKIGIEISSNSECYFEYSDDLIWEQHNQKEGTSFDFHILDKSNNKEYFFEIKFTEDGFSKAKNDSRHISKINDLYLPKIKEVLKISPTNEDCRNYYQIFRNLIRAKSPDKTVVFITDATNPNTEKDLTSFQNKFNIYACENIKYLKWQDIKKSWPSNQTQPFQFKCF